MIANAPFSPDLFITEIYPLEKPEEAFKAALNVKKNLKVIFEINKEN
jgi:threonine dehydrogenase-like Zn-dependent dehydrogenase